MTEDSTRGDRTTLSLSLSVEDKRLLKVMAADRGITVAALIHGWVQEHSQDATDSKTSGPIPSPQASSRSIPISPRPSGS